MLFLSEVEKDFNESNVFSLRKVLKIGKHDSDKESSTFRFKKSFDTHNEEIDNANLETENNETPKVEEIHGEVIEEYDLVPNFSKAQIVQSPEGVLYYKIVEPHYTSDDLFQIKRIIEDLKSEIRTQKGDFDSKEETAAFLEVIVKKKMEELGYFKSDEDADRFLYLILRNFLGFERVDPLLADPEIEDISCNGVNIPVFVFHRKYQSLETNLIFENDDAINSLITRFAMSGDRHISVANPLLDVKLPDGSRVQATYGFEVTMQGPTFTIRKYSEDPYTIIDLIDFNTVNEYNAAFMWYAMEQRASSLIVGGTASGKTTILASLSAFIPPGDKIVSIEDTPELRLPHKNWIQSVVREGYGARRQWGREGEITLFDLLRASLRQRPDFIIVGEVRGAEATTLLQAIATGHSGLSTIHGESVAATIHRLEAQPMNIPRTHIGGINLFLVIQKMKYKGEFIRRVIDISELDRIDPITREVVTNRVFEWDAETDSFNYRGRSVILEESSKLTGLSLEVIWTEIERRAQLLKALQKRNIRSYQELSKIIFSYYRNAEETIGKYRVD